jgi:hypothetical protein
MKGNEEKRSETPVSMLMVAARVGWEKASPFFESGCLHRSKIKDKDWDK